MSDDVKSDAWKNNHNLFLLLVLTDIKNNICTLRTAAVITATFVVEGHSHTELQAFHPGLWFNSQETGHTMADDVWVWSITEVFSWSLAVVGHFIIYFSRNGIRI